MEQRRPFQVADATYAKQWDVDADAHAEQMGKLLISTRFYSWVDLYGVKSLLFDQNPVFPDRGFSRLTSLGHTTILPDKQGHKWP